VRLAQRRLAARYGAEEGNVRLRRQQLADRVAQQPIVLDQPAPRRETSGCDASSWPIASRSSRLSSISKTEIGMGMVGSNSAYYDGNGAAGSQAGQPVAIPGTCD